MGYTTDFCGKFKLDREADEKIQNLLNGLARTRRMKRNVDEKKYGIEGEFYFEGGGDLGQDDEDNIVDGNMPPRTQPGLWCQWELEDDNKTIAWDGGEKFYNYIEWLEYILDKILKPNNYKLNGEVEWFGEDRRDMGKIIVKDNVVKILEGVVSYEEKMD